MAAGEESVGSEGAESEYAFFVSLIDCRSDDVFLFRTEQTAVARVRIECQHRDTGFDDAEIRLERRTQLFEPCDDLLPGQVVADLGDRMWIVTNPMRSRSLHIIIRGSPPSSAARNSVCPV